MQEKWMEKGKCRKIEEKKEDKTENEEKGGEKIKNDKKTGEI